MHICRNVKELIELGQPLHLALGVFDGVHLGHQAVIERALQGKKKGKGLAGMLTFEPHPIEVMAPGKAPRALLATLEHKQRLLESLGVDVLAPFHFDLEVAEKEGEDFISDLMQAPIKTLAVGEDWRFGRHRHGDIDLLQELSSKHGYQLEAVPPVMFDGDRISSTRIRQAIDDGNMSSADKMLGRPYSMCGEVVKGRQLGRELGFPTANLEVGRRQCPPHGVWTVEVKIEGEIEWQPGVANLGTRPTVDGTALLLEVHLLDFVGDLYGKELEVRFMLHLRSEMDFDSIDELKQQIQDDVEEARELFEA